ncbi:F-box/LRR-repeat protein 4 isoform X2 [Anastrepha obliqua]|uniref:F-box/LRR-repeat protein 4 isoform X2 n=1 Tax=Anastrepha obliqua TaxID=95512 RepID=UPI002409A7F5|nr:F-box/LRR-repeat protein 4 isoform X2 [Anastrepha obliqua]
MSSASDEDVGKTEAGAIVDFFKSSSEADNELCNTFKDSELMNISEGFCYAGYRLDQYAQDVADFSSQYGSDYSISYTAPNITGKPRKYPEYGDFPETYAMRTYGDWWKKASSYVPEIQPQNFPNIPADDYIVVYFEEYVIPEEIAVFETFNPGALIRIWAYSITKTWFCLWEADKLYKPPPHTVNKVRRFSPQLKKMNLPTRTIRLEFNHSCLGYFTEIDAVLLGGRKVNIESAQRIVDYYERQRKCSILRKLQRIQFRPNIKGNYHKHLREFFANDLNKFLNVLSNSTEVLKDEPDLQYCYKSVGLNDMPFEIMLKIFSYLDLISLFLVGQVSKFFFDVSTHPLLYSELNLKPYWHLTSSDLLCTLAKRATVLKKLDLSWCGLFNTISPTEFKKFIQQRGDSLICLRLDSCKILNASCIETLGIVCDNLRELSLRNCSTDPPLLNFSCLANLKNLERLDLFQTVIEPELILTMLENNRKLKHLNLAFCGIAVNMDAVAQHIGQYNQSLISLDLWKSRFLSSVGLEALSKCHDLEEVDFGCLREVSLGDSLKKLLLSCTKLKKLFLATVRGITDSDVENIANFCSNLEQLDLMGVSGISKERYYEVLVKCGKLQLLDLSFCDNIDGEEIAFWARTFKVNIKCSHMPNVPNNVRY